MLEGFWLSEQVLQEQQWETRQEWGRRWWEIRAPLVALRLRGCWMGEEFALQVFEALKTHEGQQAPLRELGGTEEMAELLLSGEGMSGEEGQAVLEKAAK